MNGLNVVGQRFLPGAGADWSIAAVRDFDGDGRADILWRHASGATFLWLMNGLNVVGQEFLPGSAADWSIAAVRDFNGDGRADILWRYTTCSTFLSLRYAHWGEGARFQR